MQVLGISGSLRKASFNTAALRACGELMPAGMTLSIAEIGDLPLFNQDVLDAGMPAPVKRLRDALAAAENGVAHRFMNDGRRGIRRRKVRA